MEVNWLGYWLKGYFNKYNLINVISSFSYTKQPLWLQFEYNLQLISNYVESIECIKSAVYFNAKKYLVVLSLKMK